MSKCKQAARVFGSTAGVAGLAFLALVAPTARVAEAADDPSSEPCPSRDATLSAVNALLGQSTTRPEELAQIDLTDLGDRFAITVKGRTREYAEPSHNCAQRARMAAVFVALTLAPPDIGDSSQEAVAEVSPSTDAPPPAAVASAAPPQPVAPLEAPKQPAASTTQSNWRTELDVAGNLSLDLARSRVDGGLLVRGVLSRTQWGITVGLDLPARGSFDLQGLQVTQTRYTAELAAQRNWVLGGVRVAAELGPSLTLLQLKQSARPDAERVTHWLVGAHTGLYFTLVSQRFSPFVGVSCQLLPYRIPIVVQPEGTVGHTSTLWVSASLGVALSDH